MTNYSTYKTFLLTLCIIIFAGVLTGCGGDDSAATNTASLEELSLNGSVGDGPISNANITVYDKDGKVISTHTSDANANYDITIKVPGNAYPLVIEAKNGTDVVTNMAPDMTLKSVAWRKSAKTVNLNPFTTLAIEAGFRMTGGLTESNVNLAISRILGNYSFGLDASIDPISTSINETNIASIIKASETLGEVIRRSRDALLSLGEYISGDDIMVAIAADLSGNDAAINGIGVAGADKRIADVVNTVSAQVLIEALSNNLRVNGVLATSAMDNAILISVPGSPSSETTGNVRITQQMLSQSSNALQLSRLLKPSAALDNIQNIINSISADSLPSEIETVLPPELSLELTDAINAATSGAGEQTPPPDPTVDTEAPTVPQNLNATVVSTTQVSLSWAASTDLGGGVVSGYRVYRGGVQIGMTAGTSYIDTGLSANTSYSYQVSAFDDSVNVSGKSIAVSVTMPASESTTDINPPTLPKDLRAIVVSSTQVELNWSASTDIGGGVVAGYMVYRDGSQISTVAGTSYIDMTATPGTTYSYTVRAFDNAVTTNTSGHSTAVTVTTPTSNSEPTPDTNPPTVPKDLRAIVVSSTQVELNWSASTDIGGGVVAGYMVYRDGSQISTVAGTSYVDTTVAPSTTYSYTVRAFDDAATTNTSGHSTPASVTTLQSIACVGVDILPSYDAVAVVNANPAGTTFCFKEGAHYLTGPIFARSGDKFIGESGAILDGQDTIVQAIWGYDGDAGQKNVTIDGLIIQNFHGDSTNPAKQGAIKAGMNWTVVNNEIRNNYDTGISVGRGMIIRNNHIHHNGRYALGGGPGFDLDVLIDGNEISYNNTRNLEWMVDGENAGATKFVGSQQGLTKITLINNWVHHNNGNGIWLDGNVGPNIEIAFNLVEENTGAGIILELAWGANIHDNIVINNAKDAIGKSCWHGGQITYNNSMKVRTHNNHIESTEGSNGICFLDSIRTTDIPVPETVTNCTFTGNVIKLVGNAQNGLVGNEYAPYDTGDVFFDLNTYYMSDPVFGANWRFDGLFTRAEWQATGQDLGGSFIAW